jgi:hypothetical protein
MERCFKVDLYGLVADGRGWSWEEHIRVVLFKLIRLGCEEEVSERELDIFEAVLAH